MYDSEFDRGIFMLSKRSYFERYGKIFLRDVGLFGTRSSSNCAGRTDDRRAGLSHAPTAPVVTSVQRAHG